MLEENILGMSMAFYSLRREITSQCEPLLVLLTVDSWLTSWLLPTWIEKGAELCLELSQGLDTP